LEVFKQGSKRRNKNGRRIEDVKDKDGDEKFQGESEIEFADDGLIVRILSSFPKRNASHRQNDDHRSKSDEHAHRVIIQPGHRQLQNDQQDEKNKHKIEKDFVLILFGKGVVGNVLRIVHFFVFLERVLNPKKAKS